MATKKTTKKATAKKSTPSKAAAKKTPAKKKATKKTAGLEARNLKAVVEKMSPPVKTAAFHLYDEAKKKFLPVPDGREVKFKGFEEFRFFLHKPVDNKGWNVSEASSGARIAAGKTQKEAKTEAERLLSQNGPEGLRAGVSRSLEKNGAAPGFSAPKPAKEAKKAKQPEKPATNNRGRKPKGELSQLDAAILVLKDAKEPLTCKEIVRQMFERKIWNTSGRTPGATLSASIQREIAKRGKESRFHKAERGLYELNQ